MGRLLWSLSPNSSWCSVRNRTGRLLWSFPELFLPAPPSPKALGASLLFAYGKEQFPPSVSTAVAEGAGLPVLLHSCPWKHSQLPCTTLPVSGGI